MVDLHVHSTRRRVPALPYKITNLGSKTRYSFLVMAMRLSKNVAKQNEKTRGMRTYLVAKTQEMM